MNTPYRLVMCQGHLFTECPIESTETVNFSLSQGILCSSLDQWYMIVKTADAEQVFAFRAILEPKTLSLKRS